MSILIDQCVPRKFARLLKDYGYNVSVVVDHIAANSSDENVLALAQRLDAILLTVDLDFANIHDYPPEQYAGIIVMRYDIVEENTVLATLQQALADLYRDNLRSVLVIVEPHRYRIRKS